MRRGIIARSIGLALAAQATASAQALRGVVRDSATQRPLSGVVITVLDAAGRSVGRAISNENGLYRVQSTTGARAVKTLRIGFLPRTTQYTGGPQLDLVMTPIPPLLEPVTVHGATNCPARADRIAALSLLQQARAGLLATVTARTTNRATLVRLRFIRQLDERGRISEQSVTLDSAGGLRESFGAVRSGAEFVQAGFVDRKIRPRVPIHYAPDAETLLDDDFAAGYCFQIADPDRSRPNEIGLGFKPSSRRNGRVDVEGALWIDTVAKTLRDIAFDYVGDDRPVGAPQPGGHIEFRQMGNGIVIIDRWALRLIAIKPDTVWGADNSPVVRALFHYQEVGGEVATATWDDGFAWRASLGALRALVVDYRNHLASGVVLRLEGTDYVASPNARGIIDIPYLLPGPYVGVVIDSTLARLHISLPTSLSFEAERDSLTQRSFSVPQNAEFVTEACLRGIKDDAQELHPQLSVRVIDAFGQPVVGAIVDITRNDGVPSQEARESLDTDDRGVVTSCLILHRGDPFEIEVSDGSMQPYSQHFEFQGRSVNIRLPRKKP